MRNWRLLYGMILVLLGVFVLEVQTVQQCAYKCWRAEYSSSSEIRGGNEFLRSHTHMKIVAAPLQQLQQSSGMGEAG